MNSFSLSGVSTWLIVVVFGLLADLLSCQIYVDHVNIGFSASAFRFVDTNGYFLYSMNDSFAFGISNMGTGGPNYYLCIMHTTSLQVVWAGNRNSPVSWTDLFSFRSDGNVLLTNSSGASVWSTESTGLGAEFLQLQESGNLVLLDTENKTLWQSFDHPTDTLLTGQKFRVGGKLVGSISHMDMSESIYSVELESTLVLYAEFSFPPQVYWTMADDGRTKQLNNGVPSYAMVSVNGLFGLFGSDNSLASELLLDGNGAQTMRRATLEPDGNFKLYFLSGGIWNLVLSALSNDCLLPNPCGPYGVCSSSGSNNIQCSCPSPLVPRNSSYAYMGCVLPTVPRCNTEANLNNTVVSNFSNLANVNYFANQYVQPNKTTGLEDCKLLCSQSCSCTAFFYQNDSGSCFLTGKVGTIQYDSDDGHMLFFKSTFLNPMSLSSGRGGGGFPAVAIAIGGVAIVIIAALFAAAWCLHKRRRALKSGYPLTDDEFSWEAIPGLPTRFSYKELDTATNSFKLKLGNGGFGSVYEGVLPDKSRIAVKRLESVGQGKKEFWAEVATIGSIHHVHLVRLRGFCAEGTHRLLVYEYMANGSLDKCLFVENKQGILLDWETRCNILLGTAKGLAYLHEDCRERIIHCDIKPENILLDENFVAKVSDFGLAKLMNREQSEVFTTLRGTRGYLAPEWLMNYAISEKSDVYSYGMVLLELISGRKNFDPTETSDKWYFPIYAFRQSEIGKVRPLVDPKLNGLVDEYQVSKVIRIALWCIQDEVAVRPSMKKVIKMLEGIIDVPNPPSSPQLAVRLHGRKYDGGEDSGISDFNSGDLSASRLSAPR